MDRLVSVIGPAPSEFSLEDFILTRLEPERARVTKELTDFRNQVVPSRKPGKKKSSKPRKPSKRSEEAKLLALLKEKGLTPAEFQQMLLSKELTPNTLPEERKISFPSPKED